MSATSPHLRVTLRRWLYAEADGASLAVFRIIFGCVMVWEVWRYFTNGWIARYWLDPGYHFTYFGFGWLRPLPAAGMYALFALLGILAAFVAVGWWPRLSSAALLVLFAFQFLLEQARYLNHFYAVMLFSAILVITPANARLWPIRTNDKRVRAQVPVPMWSIHLVRFQVGVIYLFAGIAKLDGDWRGGAAWSGWLFSRRDWPVVDYLVTADLDWLVFGWGAMAFDLLIVPMLLWQPTRTIAFIAAVGFHLMNAQLFNIGIFPWMMIGATTVFFRPEWPRKWIDFACGRSTPTEVIEQRSGATRLSLGKTGLLIVYCLLQISLPLRHHLYEGHVNWTEEGHRFSWRMMLRHKEGEVRLRIISGSDTTTVAPRSHLAPWQVRAMSTRPDMILQYTHFIANSWRDSLGVPVQVFVDALVSLNGRVPAPLIDPKADLASRPRTLRGADWIIKSPDGASAPTTAGARKR